MNNSIDIASPIESQHQPSSHQTKTVPLSEEPFQPPTSFGDPFCSSFKPGLRPESEPGYYSYKSKTLKSQPPSRKLSIPSSKHNEQTITDRVRRSYDFSQLPKNGSVGRNTVMNSGHRPTILPNYKPNLPQYGTDKLRKHALKSFRTSSSLENIAELPSSFVIKKHSKHSLTSNLRRGISQILENMNFRCTCKFWDGREIELEPLGAETIGEVLMPYLVDQHKPIMCVDEFTNQLVPWDKTANSLAGSTLKLCHLNKLGASFGAISPNHKKNEKRSLPYGDNYLALKQWFSFIVMRNTNDATLADYLETMCLDELEMNGDLKLSRGSVNKSLERLNRSYRRKSTSCPRTKDTKHRNFSGDPRTNGLKPNNSSRHNDNNNNNYVDGNHGDGSFVGTSGIILGQNNANSLETDLFYLEDSWELLVKPNRELTKSEMKLQSAIWEFFHTEINYLKFLRVIINVYMSVFNETQQEVFPQLEGLSIFNNLSDIYKANLKLWFGYFIKPIEDIRETGSLLSPLMLKPGVMQIPELFGVYTHYCLNRLTCRAYTQDAARQHPAFATFLEWADQQGHNHREPLWEQLVKPSKRITEYRLMLESIKKQCMDLNDRNEISEMIKRVSGFIETIDKEMTQVKAHEQLEDLASRLIYDELIETPSEDYYTLIDDYSNYRLSIRQPIRLPPPVIIFQDDMQSPRLSQTFEGFDSFKRCNHSESQPKINERISSSSTLTNSNSLEGFANRNGGCNRSDSGIGDCSGDSNANSSENQYFSNSPTISPNEKPNLWQCSFVLTKLADSSVNWKNVPCQTVLDKELLEWFSKTYKRTVPRRIIHHGNLRFKEAQGRTVETMCYLLTDQFLVLKHFKKGNNNYLRLIKLPIRLDKLIVRKGRDEGAFACAVLNDFQNITNLLMFSAGTTCKTWLTHFEVAKKHYLQLMRPEVFLATPTYLESERQSLLGFCGDIGSFALTPDVIKRMFAEKRRSRPLWSFVSPNDKSSSTGTKPPKYVPTLSRQDHTSPDNTLQISDKRARTPSHASQSNSEPTAGRIVSETLIAYPAKAGSQRENSEKSNNPGRISSLARIGSTCSLTLELNKSKDLENSSPRNFGYLSETEFRKQSSDLSNPYRSINYAGTRIIDLNRNSTPKIPAKYSTIQTTGLNRCSLDTEENATSSSISVIRSQNGQSILGTETLKESTINELPTKQHVIVTYQISPDQSNGSIQNTFVKSVTADSTDL